MTRATASDTISKVSTSQNENCWLGDQFEKPSRMRFQRRRAASTWFGGDASEPHKPLHPPHRRTHAHLEPFRRLVPRRTSLDALHQPRPQVQGIAPRHRSLQKTESMSKDSRIHKPLGIPRFTHTGTCSSRR